MLMSRSLLLAVCLLIIPGTRALAAEQPIPPLPENVILQRDVEYGKAGDRSLKLDLFLPKEPPKTPLPVIVFIHGGGWAGATRATPSGTCRPMWPRATTSARASDTG